MGKVELNARKLVKIFFKHDKIFILLILSSCELSLGLEMF
jgi:hypothetical protein